MSRPETLLDLARCAVLVERALAGDRTAESELAFQHLWPACLRLARTSRYLGPLREDEDIVQTARAEAVQNLRAGLHTYPDWQARKPTKTFADWARIVTANAVRREVRQHLGDVFSRAIVTSPVAGTRISELATSIMVNRQPATPLPMTNLQMARELLELARERLPDEQLAVLELWLLGTSFEDIAEELDLEGPAEAEAKKRAAVATLRRIFASKDGSGREPEGE